MYHDWTSVTVVLVQLVILRMYRLHPEKKKNMVKVLLDFRRVLGVLYLAYLGHHVNLMLGEFAVSRDEYG
eukprot:CAMPEP_0195521328 /NCGR_PEP_ID=MMETSP0794_2-20130614/18462_1 /TAXON_ID=515487 /ORGANISM="Stephanopyxis turris, Strain CCMP 815" /LENGTH=69 /DNA_ID=CAMNT_0040650855 /DNA_START=490 /DNA_END=700 /DNA_ORIENTATION=-